MKFGSSGNNGVARRAAGAWLLLTAALFLAAACGSQPAEVRSPSRTDDLDQVTGGMYYRQGRPVTEGWNGVPWSTSLGAFRSIYPQAARLRPGEAVWATGRGDERFFGFVLPAAYHFDQNQGLTAVSLTAPDSKAMAGLVNTLLQRLGPPSGRTVRWNFGSTEILVVNLSVVIKGGAK